MKKDRFNNEIKIGDKVLFNNQDCRANFISYEYGTVLGFTKHFVIIKPDSPEKFRYIEEKNRGKIYRSDYNILVIEDYKTKYMYLLADFDNYKKNSIKRNQEQSEQGKRNVLMSMLDVRDDFDRALENCKNEEDKNGLENIIKKYDDTLKKYGITKFVRPCPDNELVPFDPERYEAISTLPTDNKEQDNKIAYIIKPGYEMNRQIFRISQCVIYKFIEKEEYIND